MKQTIAVPLTLIADKDLIANAGNKIAKMSLEND